ncbi:ATP-binding protein [Actinoplanes sp. G11-F43]|uniref:ATP-binding protein n=1 Tax=Actinoplanes sp. G11-F43 TaxID=3424130 RepID=UPI003D32D874
MPSEVRHLVDRGRAYPLVRLTGVLDDDTTATIRSTLLAELAGQPEAVVVDVAELRVARAEALTILGEVFDETRDWPGSRLALCGPGGLPDWRVTGWTRWPDQAGAFAGMGEPGPADHRVVAELDPVPGAARRARELITEACRRWDRPGLADSACIVATEMVNNVVAHAHTPMRVLLARHGDTMSVAVRDGSATPPRLKGPAPVTAYGGRGLLLIDAIAARWGHLVLGDGKVVWARFGTA